MYFQFLVWISADVSWGKFTFSDWWWNDTSYDRSILPRFLSNGSASEELDNVKENQKSQNRNVLCCIVEVKQYYCLSYRMWKGVIRCVVPVLIYLQDSHSILSSLSKSPWSVKSLSTLPPTNLNSPPNSSIIPPPPNPPMTESQ